MKPLAALFFFAVVVSATSASCARDAARADNPPAPAGAATDDDDDDDDNDDVVVVDVGEDVNIVVTTTPLRPRGGERVQLTFTINAGAERLVDFETVHEKKLHLLMVSQDLSWFAHEHPALQADGTFTLDTVFPRGGTFRLFADFKPANRDAVVLSRDVDVDGAATPDRPLAVTDLTAPRDAGAYEVRFTSAAPTAGGGEQMTFVVTKGNQPATDLEPYLGAMGHLVIIADDAKTLLHAHPEDNMQRGAAGTVSFHTSFPAPGRYKAWAQFQANGAPIVADFVFDVRAAPRGEVDGDSATNASDAHAHHH